jgi:hypothetical protein
LAALLSKFRIDYSDVIVIPDITKKAKDETKKEFESLISGFRVGDGDNSGRKFKYNLINIPTHMSRCLELK